MNYVFLLFNIEGVFIYRNLEIIQFSKHVHIGTKTFGFNNFFFFFFFFFELAFGSNNLKFLDHLKLIWKNFGTCPHIIKKSFLKKNKKKIKK